MIARWVAWITRRPVFALAVTVLAVLGGELARRNVARDAMADLSDPQVVLAAEWMGHSATQLATEVAKVLVEALDGTAGAAAVRSSSMSGMAEVEVVFRDESDVHAGRADIIARVARARARLPPGVNVRVGPEASSTGWVFQYALADPTHRHDPLELRRLQDEILRPALEQVDGVAEVASLGGAVEQIVVEADPERLRVAGLAFSDLVSALEAAAGQRDGNQAPGARPAKLGVEQLQALAVAGSAAGDSPVRVSDVARVRVANDMPGGLADYNGAPAVGGIVVARRGADISSLVTGVTGALDRERGHLVPGLELVTVYSRAGLAQRVERTLMGALAEEIAAVVLVIVAFLLHGRSAAVPMITLSVVVLLTFAMMWIFRVPATVMSLGGIGIALGMAVDADVVALEACHRSLEASGRCTNDERRKRLTSAAASFTPAIVVSLVIAALAFLPVFAFSGENGRLLRPLAITKTFVIAAAAFVALVVAPALRQYLVRGRIVAEFKNPMTRGLVRAYRPFVHFALTRPAITLATAALALASCIPLWFRLGGEFLPRIDERDQLFMPTAAAGVSPEDAAMQLARFDRILAGHEEVATVFGKVGRADTATDPAPFSMAEITIQLHPRAEWPERETGALTAAELVATLDRETRTPGWTGAWTAPARARIDMLSTRVRTPVGVRIVAGDTARLDELGSRVRSIVTQVPGTKSAVHESLGGETRLAFVADPSALTRYGVDPGLVSSTVELFVAGGRIADVERGGRIAALRALPGAPSRRPVEQLDEITVRAGRGQGSYPVPLELLGHPAFVQTPSVVRSEAGELASYVHVDLDPSADVLGYVERAQRAVGEAQAAGYLRLGPGERIDWTGQYELLSAGKRRLWLIAPLVAVLMLLLLYVQFRSFVEALIVFASVPFALVGSVWTLYLLHYPLSAPVWVGLLSVVGLAMQTGVVMIVYIDDAFYRRLRTGRIRNREDIVAAHTEGTVRRLRPKVMTVTTMAAGLLPLLWADGAGAEIMRRVAAPMIGGLATSAFLTLEVIPVLYTLWRSWQLRRADRTGVTLESVVASPRWHRTGSPDDDSFSAVSAERESGRGVSAP